MNHFGVCAGQATKLSHIVAMAARIKICGGFAGLHFADPCGRPNTQPLKTWPRGQKLQGSIPKGVGSNPAAGIYSNALIAKRTQQGLMSIRIEHMPYSGGRYTPRQHATIFLAS
jgi:hypothetical protein